MSAVAFVVLHHQEILAVLAGFLFVVSVVVGMLPESAAKVRVIGGLVKLMEAVSALKHKDTPGTFKVPGKSAVKPAEALEADELRPQ